MNRKTLIINGSPRANGDTTALIKELKNRLTGEIVEISAFYANIAPCVDCRGCWKTAKCVERDDMDIIYGDDFDNVVLASPVYFMTLPGPVLSLLSRFQPQHAAEFFLHEPIVRREKRAALILTAGGKGNEQGAMHHSRVLFKMLNAKGFEEHTVISPKTDTVPAEEDEAALAAIPALADWLNGDSQ